MLIGICGGICAGKHEVAKYLIQHHGFLEVHLSRTNTTISTEEPTLEPWPPRVEHLPVSANETGEYSFAAIDSLLDFVTKRWQERWVLTEIWNESILERLVRRPFFLLVSITAPVGLRWQRSKDRCERNHQISPSLEEFIRRDDDYLYNQPFGLAGLIDRAEVRLINSTSCLRKLHESLNTLNLINDERLRPNWDQYFMRLASLAAQRSNCMKRRVGCVLVREKRVISTGYCGTPRNLKNCNEGGCPRCNDAQRAGIGLSTCLCIHAEENALLEAGRERIREGSILYCDTCPCLTCSVKITQVGISEVVYSQAYSMDQATAAVFLQGGVMLRQFSPTSKGIMYLGSG